MSDAAADVPELPVKLLDCPTVPDLIWPEGFIDCGEAFRLDYASQLHNPKRTWLQYFHRFSMGSKCYLNPDVDFAHQIGEHTGDGDLRVVEIPEAYDPIVIGFVERVYMIRSDGGQTIWANPSYGVDDNDAFESHLVEDLPNAFLSWSPEHQHLLVLDEEQQQVLMVIGGGTLALSEDAMVVG